MTKLHTPLCDVLRTRLPIIQAPMVGGVTTPALEQETLEAIGTLSRLASLRR